jgi:hypothetical protein
MSVWVDVLLNSMLPEADRQGIPEWPARVRDARFDVEPGWVRMSPEVYAAHLAKHEAAQVAWRAANAPPEAPPAPESVALSDFLWAAHKVGILTADEALKAARTGDIPASMEAAVLAGATPDEAFEIRLMWAAMYEAERDSPFWQIVEAKTGGAINGAILDDVFRLAEQRRATIAPRK